MKKPYTKIITTSFAIVLLIIVSFSHTPYVIDDSITNGAISKSVPSAMQWTDNFDDEDISDWQLFISAYTTSGNVLLPGNSTAEGGVLRHIGVKWCYAGYNSSVAFGTWSFDVDIQRPDDEHHFLIFFSSELFNDDWLYRNTLGEGYGAIFYQTPTEDKIVLLKGSHDTGNYIKDEYTNATIRGWKNIIVTRELSGQFYVYLDGNMILKGKNMQHTTSERFYFLGKGGPAIDNVTVSDTIDYDAAPPEWGHPFTNQQIAIGESFVYDLNATDYSGVDQWWIDDTQDFTIDDDGVITNIVDLVAGDYNITVSVNDTLGNIQTELFILSVGSPILFPMELAIVAVGVSVVVILVLVIWRKRK